MRIKFKLFCLLSFFCSNNIAAQPIPFVQQLKGNNIPRVNYFVNRVYNPSGLNDFFLKLYDLQKNNNRIISVVHLGDSHIQADFITGYVRHTLQSFFGNAGRGIVFPYQLARSNSPSDIYSGSNTLWDFNRLAHPEIQISPGVSGYVIQTDQLSANIEITVNNTERDSSQYFKRLKFFIDTGKYSSWIVRARNNDKSYFVNNDNNDSTENITYREVVLDNYSNNISLTAIPTSILKSLYGVSVENNRPGILYHSIGVNGARYDQFNKAELFWKQVADLQADLYIVSLGTNEAQTTSFNEEQFKSEVKLMIEHIKSANPGAAILITTAPDSFSGRRPNHTVSKVNLALTNYCSLNKIPLWDLYNVTNRSGSCYYWFSKGLMNKDRIHFTAEGYRMQGQLLFNALAKSYNEFIMGR